MKTCSKEIPELSSTIPADFYVIKKLLYDHFGWLCEHLATDQENKEYGGCFFHLGEAKVFFRVAKVTPKKTGQFVTFYKRTLQGLTSPFSITDPFDYLIINVHKEMQFGQFIFPKAILVKHNIISFNGKEGKRAIRVYPPWDLTENRQAKKTQSWQVDYFLNLSSSHIDFLLAKRLYQSHLNKLL